MEKKDIIEFFDKCAPWWDDDMIRNEPVIATILDNGGIREGVHILDVACGTGVLFPDYLRRGAASVTGIDISPEMAKIAQSKFPQVKVVCGDVETADFGRQFDAVMVYNAFPHFPDPARIVGVLAKLTKPGGRLSIAHGMSRDALLQHHAGRASKVSIDLLEENALAKLLRPWFEVDVIISNEQMYQLSGVRREKDLAPEEVPAPTPVEELQALLGYMVSHNDAHAQELMELAQKLKEAGKERAGTKLIDAVAEFDMVNAKLAAVLQELSN